MTGQHRRAKVRGLPVPMTAAQAYTTWWAQQDDLVGVPFEALRRSFDAGIDWATTGAAPCPICGASPLVLVAGIPAGVAVRCQSCGTRWAPDDHVLARQCREGG